jgi:hypothetical protein
MFLQKVWHYCGLSAQCVSVRVLAWEIQLDLDILVPRILVRNFFSHRSGTRFFAVKQAIVKKNPVTMVIFLLIKIQ